MDDAPCSVPAASFAHLPIKGLEDLGFVPRGKAGRPIARRNAAPGGKLPLNTNGGGLSYMRSGMYAMDALQESVRQVRGTALAQIPGAEISVWQVWAACSPPPAQSSCRMSRYKLVRGDRVDRQSHRLLGDRLDGDSRNRSKDRQR